MPALTPDADARLIAKRLANPNTLCVTCLCAEWCSVCREYRVVFNALADAYPSICFVWIDIETHADDLNEIEIEDFPTILIEDATCARFFGVTLARPHIIEQLLARLSALPNVASAPKLRAWLAGF